MPSYPDLRLALPRPAKIARLIADARPDSIHIATEGPIGLLVRRHCRKHRLPFTTSFHTRFPEYVSARAAGPGILDLGGAAPVPRRQPGGDGGDAGAGRRIAHARLSQRGAVAARRRRRAVSSARRRSRPAAADLHLRRPGRGGKESRGVSRSRSARHQGDRRRRAGARGAGRENIRRRCFLARGRAKHWRKPMPPPMCSCFRARPTPSAWCCWRRCERPAGGRVSGDRTARRDRCSAGRRAGRGSAGGLPGGADDLAAGLPRVCRQAYLGSLGARFCRQYDGYPRRRPGPATPFNSSRAPAASSPDQRSRILPAGAATRYKARMTKPSPLQPSVRPISMRRRACWRRLRCERRCCRRRCSTERAGTRVFLKPEMLQRTGSFKFRGAFNKLSSIPPAQRGGGVVAFSSGNHAQGVAAAAQILDMQATIVMPADAPLSKRERTKAYGARGGAVRSRPRGSRSHRPRHRRQTRCDVGAAL